MKLVLDRAWPLPHVLLIFLFAGGLAYTHATGLSRFSPDSWAYFELSKKIFTTDFYSFNTYRSYAFDSHSAAFPFGLPVLMAFLNLIVETPYNAVWINLGVALASYYLLFQFASRWLENEETAAILALTLFCNFQYLDEVLSGRAMPLVMLCYISAAYVFASRPDKTWLAGLLLGLACLVRFDALVVGGLFSLGLLATRPKLSTAVQLWLGMLAGFLPWVFYSLWAFGIPFASDNSWISSNAYYAFVMDYPAVASATINTEPAIWFGRVWRNVQMIPSAIRDYSLELIYPIPLTVVALLCSLRNPKHLLVLATGAVFILIAFLPFALTAYLDKRYFTPHLLVWSFLCLWACRNMAPNFANHLVLLLMGAALVSPLTVYLNMSKQAQAWLDGQTASQAFIAKIQSCQSSSSKPVRVLFDDAFLGAEYGARTELPAAIKPRGYDNFSPTLKERFAREYGPFIEITSSIHVNNFQCSTP